MNANCIDYVSGANFFYENALVKAFILSFVFLQQIALIKVLTIIKVIARGRLYKAFI